MSQYGDDDDGENEELPLCDHCESQIAEHACSSCHKRAYCSAECQREHWHAGHARVCDSLIGAKFNAVKDDKKSVPVFAIAVLGTSDKKANAELRQKYGSTVLGTLKAEKTSAEMRRVLAAALGQGFEKSEANEQNTYHRIPADKAALAKASQSLGKFQKKGGVAVPARVVAFVVQTARFKKPDRGEVRFMVPFAPNWDGIDAKHATWFVSLAEYKRGAPRTVYADLLKKVSVGSAYYAFSGTAVGADGKQSTAGADGRSAPSVYGRLPVSRKRQS